MDSPALHSRLIEELVGSVAEVFPEVHENESRFWVEELLALYRKRPIRDNTFGSGFHNLFWLYVIARMLKPEIIVESGVWKGLGTWFLRQAAPEAKLYGFDVDLSPLRYRDADATYHECDWSEAEVIAEDARHLVFFDCHVSHARRILEASKRGFRHLLLDDNVPLHKLYSTRLPPFPTLSVIMEGDLRHNERVSWRFRDQPVSYTFDAEEASRAQRLVDDYKVLPDVAGPTRFGGQSFLTFAKLKESPKT